MPTTVPSYPSPSQLSSMAVARPVSGSVNGQRWANELAFLRAHAVQSVAAVKLPRHATASTVRVAYNRSPGCNVIRVEVELHVTIVFPSFGRINASVALSGATLIAGSLLDGSSELLVPESEVSDYPVYVAYLDVSGVTAGTTQYIDISWTDVSNGTGLYRVAVHEVPLAEVDPVGAATTEVGLNGGWPNPPNKLEAGATNVSYGWARIFGELDGARYTCRRHWQLATPEITAAAWTTSSTVDGPLTWNITGAYDPDWYIRARRLYATTTANAHTLVGRLRMDAGGSSGRVRILLDGVASGTLTVPAGTTSFTTISTAVSVPTNTSGQLVKVEFDARVDGGGQTLYCSNLALIEAET